MGLCPLAGVYMASISLCGLARDCCSLHHFLQTVPCFFVFLCVPDGNISTCSPFLLWNEMLYALCLFVDNISNLQYIKKEPIAAFSEEEKCCKNVIAKFSGRFLYMTLYLSFPYASILFLCGHARDCCITCQYLQLFQCSAFTWHLCVFSVPDSNIPNPYPFKHNMLDASYAIYVMYHLQKILHTKGGKKQRKSSGKIWC